MRSWNLAEQTYGSIKHESPYQVAVLPLGATEPHNLHLPYGTDTIQVEALADAAARRAAERGARVVVLPALPFGTETNQMRFPLAMNLDPTTVAAVVQDLVASLAQHGIHKCLLLNGHGGNDLKWLLRQLYGKTPVHLFLCDWWKVAADRYPEFFDDPGDHAGDLETSLVMHLKPGTVDLASADDGAMTPARFEAVRRGWVAITRPWHALTTNSGAGDPHAATADKGRAILDIVTDRIGGFLAELAAAEVDDAFPLVPRNKPASPSPTPPQR